MSDLDHELARAGSTVMRDPTAEATDRVAAAVLAAVERQYGATPATITTRGPWRRRLGVGIAITAGAALLTGAVLLSAGHRPSPSPDGTTADTTAATDTITFVQPDPAAAARIPVAGATPLELQTSREVLAALGSAPGVESVTFDDFAHGKKGERQIAVVPTAPSGGVERWLAQIAANAIVARVNARGDTISWIVFPDGSFTLERLTATSAGAGATKATAAGQVAHDRAMEAGFSTKVTVYPLGAVATVMRFPDERGYFAPNRTDWLRIAGVFDDRTIERYVAVEAPDGTVILTRGPFGGLCYDCIRRDASPAPGTPLPASMAGPTRLEVELSSKLPAKPNVHVTIDCATPSALCDAVIADRYALLQPQVSDVDCGAYGGPRVSVKGTLGGIAIDTAYGDCSSPQRWLDTLRAAGKLTGAWKTDD